MLVLKRRIGESLIIDDNIKVEVLAIRGNQVRLGIDEPTYVKIAREELLESPERPKASIA